MLGQKITSKHRLGNTMINPMMSLGTKLVKSGNYSDLDQEVIEENREELRNRSNLEKHHKKVSDKHNQMDIMTLHNKIK